MAFFDVLKKNITTAGQVTVEKAKLAKDIILLKDQIRQDNKLIKDNIYAIGKAYLAAHEDDYEEAYAGYIQKIKELKEEIKVKEEEVAKLSTPDKCTNCGETVPTGYQFCPNCGTAVAYDTELKEETIFSGREAVNSEAAEPVMEEAAEAVMKEAAEPVIKEAAQPVVEEAAEAAE